MWEARLRHGYQGRLPWGRYISEIIPDMTPTIVVDLYEDDKYSGWTSEPFSDLGYAIFVGERICLILNAGYADDCLIGRVVELLIPG